MLEQEIDEMHLLLQKLALPSEKKDSPDIANVSDSEPTHASDPGAVGDQSQFGPMDSQGVYPSSSVIKHTSSVLSLLVPHTLFLTHPSSIHFHLVHHHGKMSIFLFLKPTHISIHIQKLLPHIIVMHASAAAPF